MVKLLKDTHQQRLLFKLRYVKLPPIVNPVFNCYHDSEILTNEVCQCLSYSRLKPEGEYNRVSVNIEKFSIENSVWNF